MHERYALTHHLGLARQVRAAALEHLRREIETDDLVAGAGERQQHPPRAAGQLQDGALVGRHGGPEGAVVAVGIDGVVDAASSPEL